MPSRDKPKTARRPGGTSGGAVRKAGGRGGKPGARGGKRGPGKPGAGPAGAAPVQPKPKKAPPAPPRPLEPGEFVQQDGQIVFIPAGWRRRVAVALTDHGLRWRYRDFSFPITTEKGHEMDFTPDFLIYDEAPKVVRVIIVPGGGEDRAAKGKAGLFKAQYRSIAVEVWDAKRMEDLGLL
ncbi:MAG TPA: hypothetical protein VHN99_12450 [Deinococcales bacterium]|nr:hypothetical protein [Deinococcales bacterium]